MFGCGVVCFLFFGYIIIFLNPNPKNKIDPLLYVHLISFGPKRGRNLESLASAASIPSVIFWCWLIGMPCRPTFEDSLG